MLFAIFLYINFFFASIECQKYWSILVIYDDILALILFPVVCLLQWITLIENGLKLRQQQDTGYTATSQVRD